MMMPMDTTKPSRKKIRLDGYDYSSSGAYFITICTMDRKPLLWKRSDADFGLSHCGETVKTAIESIEKHYKYVAVDKYCIMPNHVHLILTITADERGRMISSPYGVECCGLDEAVGLKRTRRVDLAEIIIRPRDTRRKGLFGNLAIH